MDFIDSVIKSLANEPEVKRFLKEGEKNTKMIRKLNEDTLAQATAEAETKSEEKALEKADDVVDGDAVYYDETGDMEQALTRSLKAAKAAQKRTGVTGRAPQGYPNIIFFGEAGTGKTARINAWAEKHGVNLILKQTATLDETDLGGIPGIDYKEGVVKKYTTTELDGLGGEDSVLFLDEFNRGNSYVRGTLLTLIQDHVIADSREKGWKKWYPNFLFTVIAVNPATAKYNTDILDAAERGRGRKINVKSDPVVWLRYFQDYCDRCTRASTKAGDPEEAKRWEGNKALATALFDGGLTFSSVKELEDPSYTGNGDPVNSRNLSNLFEVCDGTKEDLISLWPEFCDDARLSEVKNILKNYKDVDDKANQGLKSSPVFRSRRDSMKSAIEDIEAEIANL